MSWCLCDDAGSPFSRNCHTGSCYFIQFFPFLDHVQRQQNVIVDCGGGAYSPPFPIERKDINLHVNL